MSHRIARRLLFGIALSSLFVAGCGSSGSSTNSSASTTMAGMGSTTSTSMKDMSSTTMSGMGSTTSTGMSGMSGMKGMVLPSRVIGVAHWQGMDITARLSQAVPFIVFTGSGQKVQHVKPAPKNGAHLMVMLTDSTSHVTIPYASVWATISKGKKVVFDERQWAMISRSMGPHYGNDITLPGAGSYHLKLLISPPVVARHMEYSKIWQKPHTVTMNFNWKPSMTAGSPA